MCTGNDKILIILAMVAMLILGFVLGWLQGFKDGQKDAITKSHISVDGSEVKIELDGELYIHHIESEV